MIKSYLYAITLLLSITSFAAPLKVLLVTGGGWHDYKNQATILSQCIESNLDAKVTIKWTHTKEHPAAGSKDVLPKVFSEDFAKEFDLVIHNHCHAALTDKVAAQKMIDSHLNNKTPAILIHGAFHSWRKIDTWDEICGCHSVKHGKRAPIKVELEKPEHPISKGVSNQTWKTKEGELYITKLNSKSTSLAKGTSIENKPHTQSCVFVHELENKVRVVGITLGHHNSTMEQKEYQELLISSIKWATTKETEN